MAQGRAGASQELWANLSASSEAAAAAAALAALAAARASPPGAAQVATLLALVQPAQPPAVVLPALALLSRWARQQSLQPGPTRQADLLASAVAAAQRLLTSEAAEQAQAASACILLLGSVAPALEGAGTVNAVADTVGGVLQGGRLGTPQRAVMTDAFAAVGGLLPCLLGQPEAARWLLVALLQWLAGWQPMEPSCLEVDCVAPAYGMMRGVATAALSRGQPGVPVAALLRPAFAVLKSATAAAGSAAGPATQQAAVIEASVAVLAASGMAEGLLHLAAGSAEAAQLASEAEACLVAACTAAAAEQAAGAAAALLTDACSLAAAQLGAAARLPALQAADGVARCQVQTLLHSALSLAPLCHAADVRVPPGPASQLLRRQLDCALVQQAGALAGTLAEACRQLGGGTQQWVLQQVQAAARQALQHYRRYSLAPTPDWLARVDGAATRQLLDKLFLSCLLLLAASLEAAPPAARPLRAAAAAAALADLQFCRVSSPQQYAALLRQALAEVPRDSAAAASLAACAPSYAELAAPCATRGAQPAWLVDGAAAAKAQFLMAALTPCCGLLPQDALEDRLAPLAFLYLLHPHPATATAAHHLLCALLVSAPAAQRPALAAYYVERCLEGCPGATPPQQLAQGLATVMEALPVGSPVALLCLQQVLERCRELAARGDPAAPELAAVAAQQLLVMDHLLLDEAMAAFDRAMSTHPPGAAAAAAEGRAATAPGGASTSPAHAAAAALLRGEVLAAVQRSDDCVRKPVLAGWLLAGGGG